MKYLIIAWRLMAWGILSELVSDFVRDYFHEFSLYFAVISWLQAYYRDTKFGELLP